MTPSQPPTAQEAVAQIEELAQAHAYIDKVPMPDDGVVDWGDHFVAIIDVPGEPFGIFGQVLPSLEAAVSDPEATAWVGAFEPTDPATYVKQLHDHGYRPSRCHSGILRNGGVMNVHVDDVLWIPPYLFDMARRCEWDVSEFLHRAGAEVAPATAVLKPWGHIARSPAAPELGL